MEQIKSWNELTEKLQEEPILLVYLSSTDCGVCKADELKIDQIRKDYAEANAEQNYTVRTTKSSGGYTVRKYLKNSIVKKIIIIYYEDGDKTVQEQYIKNGKPYFIVESSMESMGKKRDVPLSHRYYYDPDGILIRYIDEEGYIHEDEEVMVEIDSDMEEYWNSVIGNY